MTTKNKIILSSMAVILCAFVAFGMFVPQTAKAVENVQTSFTSNTYLNTIYAYRESDVTNISNVWFYSTWYIDFVVDNNGINVFYYSLDTNYTTTAGGVSVDYVRNPLTLRTYSDTSERENYFLYYVNSSGTRRCMDYICQYEYVGSGSVLPSYLTVSYTSISNTIWNWTAKRVDNNTECPIVCQYTWGNDSYRVTLSFIVRTTRDFYESVQTTPYSYTMYYSADSLQGGSSWQDGYNAGVLKGEQQANNTINENSASYIAGYNKGVDSSFDITKLIAGASNALSVDIFGNFSILDLVGIVFAIVAFILFLKMFAGG